jgi:hypothetical protein
MGTGRIWRKKPLRRPKKTGTDRRRRQRMHRERLVELGADPKAVSAMNPKRVRAALNTKRRAAAKKA